MKASPLDPPWLKEGWAKLEPQAELSEAVRKDLEAQKCAQRNKPLMRRMNQKLRWAPKGKRIKLRRVERSRDLKRR